MTQTNSLTIAGKTYASRLLVGSGKYKDLDQTRLATEASGAEIITVAIRRVNIGQDPNAPSLLDVVPPSKYTILPNTAGCYTAKDAIYTLQLGRELLGGHKLCKLEVLGDEKTLFPNMPETLEAAKVLVKEGFEVMVNCSDDTIQAKMMAIVDIYDALTASDRPYKKAVPWERALDILRAEVSGGKLDRELFRVFVDAGVFRRTVKPE